MLWSVAAYLTAAMVGVFFLFWELGEETINWTKFISFTFLVLLSLFLSVEDILYKDRSAKDVEIRIIQEIRAGNEKTREQIDSISHMLDSLPAKKRSMQDSLRSKPTPE